MSVDTHQGEPICLHTLRSGPASHSYGIPVAKQAGLPSSIIDRAYQLSHNLENTPLHLHTPSSQTDSDASNRLAQKLSSIDPNQLTPLAALKLIFELKQEI